jgi:hypothetical protein
MGIESNDQRMGQFWEKFIGGVGGGPSQDLDGLLGGPVALFRCPQPGRVSR